MQPDCSIFSPLEFQANWTQKWKKVSCCFWITSVCGVLAPGCFSKPPQQGPPQGPPHCRPPLKACDRNIQSVCSRFIRSLFYFHPPLLPSSSLSCNGNEERGKQWLQVSGVNAGSGVWDRTLREPTTTWHRGHYSLLVWTLNWYCSFFQFN